MAEETFSTSRTWLVSIFQGNESVCFPLRQEVGVIQASPGTTPRQTCGPAI